jgi:hypothetical protein
MGYEESKAAIAGKQRADGVFGRIWKAGDKLVAVADMHPSRRRTLKMRGKALRIISKQSVGVGVAWKAFQRRQMLADRGLAPFA